MRVDKAGARAFYEIEAIHSGLDPESSISPDSRFRGNDNLWYD